MPIGHLSPWSTGSPMSSPLLCLGDSDDRYERPCHRPWYQSTTPIAGTSGPLFDSSTETEGAPSLEPQESDFIENYVATWLWVYIAPTLLLFGTCGNILSLAVLRGCLSFRKSSVGFTLSVLAIVDTGVLYVPLLRHWIQHMTDYTLDLRSIGGSCGCKVHFFLSYFLSQLSSWTVIVVTVERTMFVAMPIIAKVFCSRSRIVLLWSIIASSLFALNSHFFFTAHYSPIVFDLSATTDDVLVAGADQRHQHSQNDSTFVADEASSTPNVVIGVTDLVTSNISSPDVDDLYELLPEILTCQVSPEWFLTDVWYWIDFAVLSVVPFLVVATGNFVIGYCVVRALQFRRRHQRRDPNGGGNVARDQIASSSDKGQSQASVGDVSTVGGGGGGGGSRDRKSKPNSGSDKYSAAMASSTLMLMGVSVTFLVTTVPNVVYFLKVDEWLAAAESNPDRVAGKRQEARVTLIYAVTNLLLYANNSINFLLYCLTGSRFRRAARDLFSRSGVKRPSTGTGGNGGVGGAVAGYNGGGASNGTAGCRRMVAVATPSSRARASGTRGVGIIYSSATVSE